MFILFQNTSRNVILCLPHVILKWKISWLNNIIVLTTDWWGKYTSGIYHLYVKIMELFTIVIYRKLHNIMEELIVFYTPLFLWREALHTLVFWIILHLVQPLNWKEIFYFGMKFSVITKRTPGFFFMVILVDQRVFPLLPGKGKLVESRNTIIFYDQGWNYWQSYWNIILTPKKQQATLQTWHA